MLGKHVGAHYKYISVVYFNFQTKKKSKIIDIGFVNPKSRSSSL